ncbi:hypothetical protein [Mobilicoccus pelagius]|uniref:DUF3618 domain-containing protein n=1 Tax=Mobilicoccus pelagius NBRC 104925 TaxID=1089455 RepID=H5UVD3_9MICO|nr:hypothetical protein [Mobilicoccus pelagius]GAB49691.1 hypothetical protein MOPEL_132_00580 [Mobilicoccus pelagius NBRC 104925]
MSSPHEPLEGTAGAPGTRAVRGPGDAAEENANKVADDAKQRAADVTDTAKDNAGAVAETAKEGAGQVADTAKQEARAVANEAGQHVQALVSQVRDDVSTQVGTRQQEIAAVLGSLGSGLDRVQFGDQPADTLAADLAQQAAARLQGVGTWLEQRGPVEVLDEVKRFARRRPGTFLAAAALTGLVAGRLTRGMTDDARDDEPQRGDDRMPMATRRTATPVVPAYEAGYDTPGAAYDAGQAGHQAQQPAYGRPTHTQPAYVGEDVMTTPMPTQATDDEGRRR